MASDNGTKEHSLTAGSAVKEEDGKSGPTAGKSGPTAGTSDPAEALRDVTRLPRDALQQKDADANEGKSQLQRGVAAPGVGTMLPHGIVIPSYFRGNRFAALSALEQQDVEQDQEIVMEANARSALYERKTPKPRKKRVKPVDQQVVPTPRTRKETYKRPSPKSQRKEQPTAEEQQSPGGSAPRDTEDWMYSRERFHDLDQKYGPFSLDAAASAGGENAQCKRFYSAQDSFLEKKLDGETIWANFPYQRAEQFLDHYLEEKTRDPRNAGMFVLPKWTSATWWSKVQHMEIVKEHPQGERLFTAPPKEQYSKERLDLGPSPWPVCVFWDPPREESTPREARLEEDSRVEADHLCEEHSPTVD